MRLFTGLSIPEEVEDNLERTLRPLRAAARLSWSARENFHITTKFVGSWPDERLEEMQQALAAVERGGEIQITVARFGFFPNPHHPRVFFAGVQAGPELTELASRIDESLAGIGCAREQGPYRPHLTLARIKDDGFRPLREKVAAITEFDFGTFTAREFHLYRSETLPGGSVYTKLASFPLC